MKKYWKMVLNAAKKSAEIIIYENIGKDFWSDEGISLSEFAKDLSGLGNVKNIDLHVCSNGGCVTAGLGMYSLLKAHKAYITGYNDGVAASIASVVLMSADKVIMSNVASFMIHDPWTGAIGSAEEMRRAADALDTIKVGLVAAYTDKTGLSEEEIDGLMSKETWLTAEQSLDFGFADEISESMQMVASVKNLDFSKFKNVPDALKNIDNTVINIEDNVFNREAFIKKHAEGFAKFLAQDAINESGSNKPDGKLKKEVVTMEKCKQCGQEHKHLDANGFCNSCASANVQAATEKAVRNETVRVQAITKMGDTYKCAEDAEKFIDEKKSIDAFRAHVMDKIEKDGFPVNTAQPGDDLGAQKPFNSVGEQLAAIYSAAIRPNTMDKRLHEINNAATGMGEDIGSDGGFLVQQDFTLALMDRANQESDIAPLCRTIPIGPGANGLKAPYIDETSRATGSRWGGIQVYRKDEGTAATAKKPKLGKIDLTLEKLIGLCYVSDELLADQSALGAIVTQAFGEEFAFVKQDEIINGSGAGQMKGIMKSGGPLVSVAKETGQAAASIVTENLDKMYARMYARGLRNAVWLINQDCWPELFNLYRGVGTAGIPVFTPPGGIAGAPYGMIHGRPILPIEQCQTVGTTGDIILADFTQYLIIEKDGLQSAQSMHVKFIEDEMTFRFTMRNNGQPLWKTAVTPYKGSNTQSPFVALAERA